jgi:hypothetical protein
MCEIVDVVFLRPNLTRLVAWVFVVGSIGVCALVAHLGVNVLRAGIARSGPAAAWLGLLIAQIAGLLLAEILRQAYDVDEQTSMSRIAGAQLGGIAVVLLMMLLVATRSSPGARASRGALQAAREVRASALNRRRRPRPPTWRATGLAPIPTALVGLPAACSLRRKPSTASGCSSSSDASQATSRCR